MGHLGLRINEGLERRLDALKEARGAHDRSQVVRALILEASDSPEQRARVPDRDELLVLLGEAARGGSVQAMKTLLDERRRDGDDNAQPAASFIDELAGRRAAGP